MGELPSWMDPEEVGRLRLRTWALTRWHPTDAWQPKDNPRMWQNRAPEDPAGWVRLPLGWDHEHCKHCFHTIRLSDDPATSEAYSDGIDWLCRSCHATVIE